MTYQESLDWLYTQLPMYQRIGMQAFKKDLTNTLVLLEALDNPHQDLKFVHVAGTNGKGSTCHMLASCLSQAGYKTGLYTSPHLKSFTERIQIDFQPIPEQDICEFVNLIRSTDLDISPSFFEMTVAMAFWFFKKQTVDIAIIETGLGGRLDSTNVIDPLVAVITRIGLDHTDMLGDTIELIAAEKAGIIKKNTPVVIAANQPEVQSVFEEKAESLDAPIHLNTGYYQTKIKEALPDRLLIEVWNDKKLIYNELSIGNGAEYILDNIPGVLATVKILATSGFTIEEEALRKGLANFQLKGRMQIIGNSPLTIADISHNTLGIRSLIDQITKWQFAKLFIVIGMVRDKNIGEVLELLPKNAKYIFTQSSVPRSLESAALMQKAISLGLRGEIAENVNEGIAKVRMVASENDLVLVCGSTFVVAEIDDL